MNANGDVAERKSRFVVLQNNETPEYREAFLSLHKTAEVTNPGHACGDELMVLQNALINKTPPEDIEKFEEVYEVIQDVWKDVGGAVFRSAYNIACKELNEVENAVLPDMFGGMWSGIRVSLIVVMDIVINSKFVMRMTPKLAITTHDDNAEDTDDDVPHHDIIIVSGSISCFVFILVVVGLIIMKRRRD